MYSDKPTRLRNRISIPLLICFILAILYFIFMYPSSASSPEFVRQDITDGSNDMILAPPLFNINKNLTTYERFATEKNSCEIIDLLTNSSLNPYGDISEVSYLSNGKFFNATLWINDYLNFSKPTFPEGIDILELNPKNLTLFEIANNHVRERINAFNLSEAEFIIKNENTTLGKEPGLKFVVKTTTNDASRTEEIYQWVIVEHNKRIYDFVFSSLSHRYGDLLDDVEKIKQSIVFIDNDIDKTNFKNNPAYHYQDDLKIAFKKYPTNSEIENLGNAWIRINFPIPDFKLISKSYQMLIDVVSTFDNGIDYIDKIEYDNSSKKWKDTFYEIKSLIDPQRNDKFENNGNLRIIDEKDFNAFPVNLLNKFSRQNFSVPFSVDLSHINFPNTYDVYFVTTSLYKTNNNLCNIIDATSFTPIPPPKINITVIPTSLEIRPGEEKSLEIKIEPSTRLPYLINLTSLPRDIINSSISPNLPSIIHNEELFITNLKINALKQEGLDYPRYYSLPIIATFSIVPSHKDLITNLIIKNELFSKMNSTIFLPIKVNPPLNAEDFLNSISQKIASPIGQILTTLGIIVGGIIGIGKWFISRKNEKSKGQ
jgi:hypothetical protein